MFKFIDLVPSRKNPILIAVFTYKDSDFISIGVLNAIVSLKTTDENIGYLKELSGALRELLSNEGRYKKKISNGREHFNPIWMEVERHEKERESGVYIAGPKRPVWLILDNDEEKEVAIKLADALDRALEEIKIN